MAQDARQIRVRAYRISAKRPQAPHGFSLPSELAAMVARTGKRAKSAIVADVLVALCRHRVFRGDELAALLGRDPGYLVRTYLTPLVEAGRLERLYPQMLNHPDQAYRAPEGEVPNKPPVP